MLLRKIASASILLLLTTFFFFFGLGSNYHYFWVFVLFSALFIFTYGILTSFLADKFAKGNIWLSLLYHAIAGFIFPIVILTLSGDLRLSILLRPEIHPFVFFALLFWFIDQMAKRFIKA
ncbi:hypothetical protein [Desmospora activa]|uniref:hypothetical protein n=1 Tax=Desmospora activa TaxID=500615 RepID=UPI000D31A695|nr:hypothetical protein [Desmospora activa]